MSESKQDRKGKRKAPECSLKSVCIFGEPVKGKSGEFLNAANDLGTALAARKIKFIYGGGVQGLRGSAAMTACLKGGKVISITVKDFTDHFFSLGQELKVSNLHERMGYMFTNAEAFIALPGGLETLDGISSIAFWAKLNCHKKPLGLLNVNGFYDCLLCFLDLAIEKGFIDQATRNIIISAPTANQLIDQLQAYVAPPIQQVDGQSSGSSSKQDPDTTLRL